MTSKNDDRESRHEALRRLGVEIRVCPLCKESFRADQAKRWVIEDCTAGGYRFEDPFCSEECAEEKAASFNSEGPKYKATCLYRLRPDLLS